MLHWTASFCLRNWEKPLQRRCHWNVLLFNIRDSDGWWLKAGDCQLPEVFCSSQITFGSALLPLLNIIRIYVCMNDWWRGLQVFITTLLCNWWRQFLEWSPSITSSRSKNSGLSIKTKIKLVSWFLVVDINSNGCIPSVSCIKDVYFKTRVMFKMADVTKASF